VHIYAQNGSFCASFERLCISKRIIFINNVNLFTLSLLVLMTNGNFANAFGSKIIVYTK
jgi:hypothetical protein